MTHHHPLRSPPHPPSSSSQPQPQHQPYTYLHLLVSPFPFPSPMGEQTLTLTQTPTPHPSSSAPNPPSPSRKDPSDPTPASSAAPTAKIPFRPRKIRKVSGESDGDPSSSSSSARAALRAAARPLSADGEVAAAIRHLRAADPLLAPVIDVHEPPIFERFHPPFHCLVRSILYQQLAYKAAASIYARFLSLCGGEAGVLPDAVLALTPHQLRQIGISARKASYLHDLARKYHSGILSDAAIVAMDDKSLFSMLTMVNGIGAWSVHMFMIFSLHRPDVLPVGDLGVRKGVQILYGLNEVPRPSQMEQYCDKWRPYRSVGAWYMWRLVDNKGPPNLLPPTGGVLAIAGSGDGLGAIGPQQQHQQQQQHQHAQLIDPIQMLPTLR
ncbi:probable DNA-3-methyladenine glycosylase 2 [Ananas comosus]|uniref:Probable DNA-3-methyladenine glycosylase 2 n=1 Tax=Ananas comosus TaxID=4615 RepID=A0A6P5FUP4_ANACO|nr:probable DNA-3-methyladenine glycosylase 2 [Ananas comosus]